MQILPKEKSDSLKKFIKDVNNSFKLQNLKSLFIGGEYALENTQILDETLSAWKKLSHDFGISMDPMIEIGISMLGVLANLKRKVAF